MVGTHYIFLLKIMLCSHILLIFQITEVGKSFSLQVNLYLKIFDYFFKSVIFLIVYTSNIVICCFVTCLTKNIANLP